MHFQVRNHQIPKLSMSPARTHLHVQNGFLHERTPGEPHMHHGNDTQVGVQRAQVDETPQAADGKQQQACEPRRTAVVPRRLADGLRYRDGGPRHLGDGKLSVMDGRSWAVCA